MEVGELRGRAADLATRLSPAERDELAVIALTIRLAGTGLETDYRRQVLALLGDLAPTLSLAVQQLLRPVARRTAA